MKFFKCLICLCVVITFFTSNIYATNDIDILNLDISEEEIEIQKDKLKKEVSNLIEELRITILGIDEKIELLRKTDEYLTYPIIRLNIDTPILGMKSIINQKLKITNDVSAADVAKGYSIRDIVKNKMVKLPDVTIASIVISTKEINIDDELSIAQYNTLILKLMNYVDKAISVSDFLDTQTNKMFKEYVSKEKKEKLNDFDNRLKKINNDLLDSNDELVKIYFINKDSYFAIEEKYIELSKTQKQLEKEVDDVLIESSKLNDLQKDIISFESEVIDYLSEINKIEIEDIDISDVYLKVYNNLNNKLKMIEEYIESSTKEQLVETELDNKEIESKEQKVTEVEILYEVFSGKSVNNMKNIVSNLEEKMDELDITYKIDEENDEDIEENVEKEIKSSYKKLTNEEIDEEFELLIQKYDEFLDNEYTYYLDNVNGLLDSTNEKVKKLASVSDVSIISEVKYIYIELPINLENSLDTYSTNSIVQTKYLISNFKKELNKLSSNYTNILKLYKELESEEKLNNA